MAYRLTKRFLKVTFSFPNNKTVVVDQSLNIRVRIEKNVLALQNKAEIEITNMTSNYRSMLLSSFTAWKKRLIDSGQVSSSDPSYAYIPVTVEAGYYDTSGKLQSAVIYKGEVALVDPVSPPPNISVRVTAYSRQLDKTKFVTDSAPYTTTYYNYVKWAANQMGIPFDCTTSHNNDIQVNPARSRYTVAALMWDIQDAYKPDIVAFVDDDFLYVRDRNKILNTSSISNVTNFIGTPTWTEWGVSFKTLLDITLKLAQGAKLTSLMNPVVNGTYVITKIEYDLTSRDGPFYSTVQASPAAT